MLMNKRKWFRKYWDENVAEFDDAVCRFNTSFELEECTLRMLFDMPEEDEVIFTRVIALNQLYSAGLTDHEMSEEKAQQYEINGVMKPVSVRRMADHIIKNKERLRKLIEVAEPDKAVKALMEVSFDPEGMRKYRNAFSFATKYCSWCKSGKYPIIDQYVREFMYHWYCDILGSQRIKFEDFDICVDTVEELYQDDTYKNFVSLVEGFQRENGLTDVDKKEVDKFIWTSGKDWISYWDTVKRIISINEYAIDYYHQQLIDNKDKIHHILDEWGLSDEIIEQNRIGLADDDDSYVKLRCHIGEKGVSLKELTASGFIKEDADGAGMYSDNFYGRILFPIFAKTGEPVSVVGRSYLNDRKQSVYLWLPNTSVFSQEDKNRCIHILEDQYKPHQTVQETISQILNLRDHMNL